MGQEGPHFLAVFGGHHTQRREASAQLLLPLGAIESLHFPNTFPLKMP